MSVIRMMSTEVMATTVIQRVRTRSRPDAGMLGATGTSGASGPVLTRSLIATSCFLLSSTEPLLSDS